MVSTGQSHARVHVNLHGKVMHEAKQAEAAEYTLKALLARGKNRTGAYASSTKKSNKAKMRRASQKRNRR